MFILLKIFLDIILTINVSCILLIKLIIKIQQL
jgi:hypothetical protein